MILIFKQQIDIFQCIDYYIDINILNRCLYVNGGNVFKNFKYCVKFL